MVPKRDSIFDEMPALGAIGKACLLPFTSLCLVIGWVIGFACYQSLLCIGIIPDPKVDEARADLRAYSQTHFGCDAEDLEMIAPKRPRVLPNTHTKLYKLKAAAAASKYHRANSAATGKKGVEMESSGDESPGPEDEDKCPELEVPSFTRDSFHRWLRWAYNFGCVFDTIMKDINLSNPMSAEKEEHIARVWAERQWDHWQCSCDPLVVLNKPQVTHEERVMAMKEALKDLQRSTLGSVKSYSVDVAHEIINGQEAGRQRYLTSQERLQRYERTLKKTRQLGVEFEPDGRPPPPPPPPPLAPYPATLSNSKGFFSLSEENGDWCDGTSDSDSEGRVGVRQSVSSPTSPFALRRSAGKLF